MKSKEQMPASSLTLGEAVAPVRDRRPHGFEGVGKVRGGIAAGHAPARIRALLPTKGGMYDAMRLRSQRDVIRDVMLAAAESGTWLTLAELRAMTQYGEASIPAQLRHLRKIENGGYEVVKRHREDGAVAPEAATDRKEFTGSIALTEGETRNRSASSIPGNRPVRPNRFAQEPLLGDVGSQSGGRLCDLNVAVSNHTWKAEMTGRRQRLHTVRGAAGCVARGIREVSYAEAGT